MNGNFGLRPNGGRGFGVIAARSGRPKITSRRRRRLACRHRSGPGRPGQAVNRRGGAVYAENDFLGFRAGWG